MQTAIVKPFDRNAQLPAAVVSALPPAAQDIWRLAFNDAFARGVDEGGSVTLAWIAVDNAGYKQSADDGTKWVKKRFDFEIVSKDVDQQLVFGWLYVSKTVDGEQVVDHSGETIAVEEVEKAVYGFVLESRQAGEMHDKIGVGRIVESFVSTPEKRRAMSVPDGVLPDGAWVGFKIDDPKVWEGVKVGKFKMFSLGGKAIRRSLEG